jgi:hypothetical protein
MNNGRLKKSKIIAEKHQKMLKFNMICRTINHPVLCGGSLRAMPHSHPHQEVFPTTAPRL